MNRLENLLESSRPGVLRDASPLNGPNSKVKSSNSDFASIADKSLYEKYSKIWSNRSISTPSLSYFLILIKKLQQRKLLQIWNLLKDNSNDPLAFTLCTKCGTSSLTLLTSSTQENLSPRFLSKIKNLLPKRAKNSNFLRHSPKLAKKISDKGSIVLYSGEQNFSPVVKAPISNISPIAPNSYFLTSLSSPEQNFRPKFGNEEVSFDVSRESYENKRENSNLPKQIVPKLKIRSNLERQGEGLQRFFSVFQLLMCKRMDFGVCKIKELRKPLKTDLGEQVSKIQKQMTSSKRTAFKIFYSRLEKFIFRRKMQGFYSISELLYR